jgi:hypothetical protein
LSAICRRYSSIRAIAAERTPEKHFGRLSRVVQSLLRHPS